MFARDDFGTVLLAVLGIAVGSLISGCHGLLLPQRVIGPRLR
jgi:hypothetical protein